MQAAAGRDYALERRKMVLTQIAARGVENKAVLSAMRAIAREAFTPEGAAEFAYADGALPIACGQTISQPYVVAKMLELADPKPGDRALEVGAGSGYAAALLGALCKQVFAIERHRALADAARTTLKTLGAGNVEVVCGDGAKGLATEAPFDVILVSAGGGDIPPALAEQQAIGGRLVMPLTARGCQVLTRVTRRSEKEYAREEFTPVMFVPLVIDAAPESPAQS